MSDYTGELSPIEFNNLWLVRKRHFCDAILYHSNTNHHFTKTGSGQTQGKHSKKRDAFSQLCDPAIHTLVVGAARPQDFDDHVQSVIKYLLQPILVLKRLKLRLSGSARKLQKRFQDTPRFKFQAVLGRIQPSLSRSVEKQGDQSRFRSLGLYTNVGRSRYEQRGELVPPIEAKLNQMLVDTHGAEFIATWWKGLPDMCE